MKKIMIAMFAVTMSVIANAATVSWTMTGISASPDNATTSTFMAYLFDTSAGYSSIMDAISSGDTSVLSSAIGTKNVTATGALLAAKATTDMYSTGDYVTAFAVVLNNATPENATYFLAVPEVTSSSAVSSAGTVTVAFGSQASNTNWQAVAVPEPTSGLLMLLGMAGLALRRRRA